jgi:hypothetical protein
MLLFFVLEGGELVAAIADGGRRGLVIFTKETPSCIIPSFCAAIRERSRPRPRTYGPRSLMRTFTERPFLGFVTFTTEPSGRVFEAAVN